MKRKITIFSFYEMLLSSEIIPNRNTPILSYVINESQQRNHKCEEQFIIKKKPL